MYPIDTSMIEPGTFIIRNPIEYKMIKDLNYEPTQEERNRVKSYLSKGPHRLAILKELKDPVYMRIVEDSE